MCTHMGVGNVAHWVILDLIATLWTVIVPLRLIISMLSSSYTEIDTSSSNHIFGWLTLNLRSVCFCRLFCTSHFLQLVTLILMFMDWGILVVRGRMEVLVASRITCRVIKSVWSIIISLRVYLWRRILLRFGYCVRLNRCITLTILTRNNLTFFVAKLISLWWI